MKRVLIIISLIIVLTLLCVIPILNKNNSNYDFKIYFFNAGKADAILLSKDGKYIMIDTGEESLSNEILAYFKNNNIKKLDYLIITHFDKDHVGSAATIINSIEVDNVLQSNYPKESEVYNKYLEALSNKKITPITVSGNYEIELAGLNIVVNGPDTIYEKNASNNSSLIISVEYNNNSFLLMGDSENARLKDFIELNNNTYDFIKVPYHGNYLKRLSELLEETNTKYAVITSSNEEQEDSETLELLEKYGIKYYITRNGEVTVLSDGDKIKID